MNTMIELVDELKAIPLTPYMALLIGKAKSGEFHDFRSKAVCGKHYAVECFDHVLKHDKELADDSRAKLMSLRGEIINGLYDEILTDEDRKIVKRDTLADSSLSDKDKRFFFSAMGITDEH